MIDGNKYGINVNNDLKFTIRNILIKNKWVKHIVSHVVV
jgi:hypothetical protein